MIYQKRRQGDTVKKKILAVTAIVLIAALIPTALWGISRLQLKKENTNFIKGIWVETDWDKSSTFDPTDEALYHTIDFDSSKDFNLLCLTDIHYRNDGWYRSWAITAARSLK